MRSLLAILAVCFLATPGVAAVRYPFITMVAIAKVLETHCGQKGMFDAALAKAKRSGVQIDLNDKKDAAEVQDGVAIQSEKANSLGVSSWCRLETARVSKLVATP